MKKLNNMSIRYSAMLIMVLITIPIFLIAFGINYFNFKNDILENTDIAINQSKYFITETISNTEKNQEFISEQYSRKMTESLKYFQTEYIKNKDNLNKIDLQEMKKKYNNILDFYIISKDGVIIYSSTPIALGINFKSHKIFYKVLNKVREGDKIQISNVTSEMRTNQLRKWGYAPSYDHKYILEVGLSSKELMKYIKKIDYSKMEKTLKSKNPYIKNLKVYDRQYVNLGDYILEKDINEQKIIDKVLSSQKNYIIKNKDGFISKEYLFIKTFSNVLDDSQKVIKLEYDYSIIYKKIHQTNIKLLMLMFVCIFTSLIVVFLVASNMIIKPITRLIKHVQKFSYNELSSTLEIEGTNEISQLASSFNEMALKLKNTLISKENIKTINKELTEENTKDWLTKIYNKKYLSKYLMYAEELAKINDSELSVVMCDIDFFKVVNDKYGHPVGDIVLQEIASIIKENIRLQDTVGRYGGEEFLIIFPNTNLEDSFKIFETIRKKIENHSFSNLNIKVTISGGLASTKNKELKGEENLVSLADKNLYIAKENGRNQGIK